MRQDPFQHEKEKCHLKLNPKRVYGGRCNGVSTEGISESVQAGLQESDRQEIKGTGERNVAMASRANLAFRVGSCTVSPVSFHGFLLRPCDAGVWFLWAT